MVKTKVIDLKNPPCRQCETLGRTARNEGKSLILLTISPDPHYKGYADMLPDTQYEVLRRILHDKRVIKDIRRYFTFYDIIGEHFEFNRSGQLHSHNIVAIPNTYFGYVKNLIFISKKYHKICGMQYANCQIAVNTKWVDDELVNVYLNKENAYPPVHLIPPMNVVEVLGLTMAPPSPQGGYDADVEDNLDVDDKLTIIEITKL